MLFRATGLAPGRVWKRTATGRPVNDPATAYHRRWYTLGVLCLSLLVIVVDSTIVNVALVGRPRDAG